MWLSFITYVGYFFILFTDYTLNDILLVSGIDLDVGTFGYLGPLHLMDNGGRQLQIYVSYQTFFDCYTFVINKADKNLTLQENNRMDYFDCIDISVLTFINFSNLLCTTNRDILPFNNHLEVMSYTIQGYFFIVKFSKPFMNALFVFVEGRKMNKINSLSCIKNTWANKY